MDLSRLGTSVWNFKEIKLLPSKEPVLYRAHPNGGAVFAYESDARRTDAIYRALQDAKTWGQFREMLPEGEWASIRRMVKRIPNERTAFEGYEDIPAASDGDYPPWLQQQLADVLPAIILDRFAEQKSSAVNGLYWHIDWDKADQVAEALRELGLKVSPADELKFF